MSGKAGRQLYLSLSRFPCFMSTLPLKGFSGFILKSGFTHSIFPKNAAGFLFFYIVTQFFETKLEMNLKGMGILERRTCMSPPC